MTTPTSTLPARPVPPAKALRRLFLTLFLRGRSSRGLQLKGAPKSVGRRLLSVLIFYALFGCIALTLAGKPVFALAIYLHGMTFVFLGMFVSSSAGEVLFNKEENDILLHRPITPQALLWAKISVLAEISLWIAGAFNLAGMIGGIASGGWAFPIVHAASTVLEALFCTACVVMVYQLCIRWFGREKLDSLMTTAQIFVSIAAVLSGQVIPRMVNRFGDLTAFATHTWWIALLPPAWFASFDDALVGKASQSSIALALVGVLATAGVVWIAFVKLARDYQAGLQRLMENVPPRAIARPAGKSEPRRRWLTILVAQPPLKWWLRDPVSRAAFSLTASYLFRDRETKLRIYPSLAPMLIIPFVFLFQGGQATGGTFQVAFSGAYLGIVPLLAVSILRYSQQWQAADIFRVAPIAGPAAICNGTRRAVLLFLALPVALVFVVVTAILTHGSQLLLMLLPGILVMPIYAILPSVTGKGVPFSLPTEEGKAAGRGLSMIGALVFSFVIAAMAALSDHFGLFYWFLGAELLVVTLLYWALRHALAGKRWEAIE